MAVALVAIIAPALIQPAVEQDLLTVHFKEVLGAGGGASGTAELELHSWVGGGEKLEIGGRATWIRLRWPIKKNMSKPSKKSPKSKHLFYRKYGNLCWLQLVMIISNNRARAFGGHLDWQG